MRETKKKAAMVYGYEDDDVTAEYEGLSDKNEEVTNTGVTKRSTEEYTDAIRANIIAKRKAKEANHELGKSEKEIKDNIDNAKGAQKDWANTLVAAANGITSLFSAINMLKGAWNVI
jgi:seryl-tRNA synthetase